MIELRSDPYVLKPRTTPITEADFRVHLNIGWCRGILFNVVALRNSIAIVEYDAILWGDDQLMFIEYKDSVNAYKDLSSRRIQQMAGLAKNIARGLGYKSYSFIVVVKGLEEAVSKSGVEVLPLYLLGSYEPVFQSTIVELEFLEKMIARFSRAGQEDAVRELEKLKNIMEMGSS